MEDLKALTECAECTWDYIDQLRMAFAAVCKERDELKKELHETKSELDAAVCGQETLQKALAEVKAERSWISVKERLPERTMPPHDVLVHHDLNCGMYIDRAWYSHDKNKWRNVLSMNLKATHWMPLPEPPEKEA